MSAGAGTAVSRRGWAWRLRAAAVAVLGAALLAGCGGGSSSSSASSPTAGPATGGGAPVASNVAPSASNVLPVAIKNRAGVATPNTPYVSVTVCQPGNRQSCITIGDVLVDTGSTGLRLFASALGGFSLPPITTSSGAQLANCAQFASGYAWGGMYSATVVLGGQVTTQPVPVQVVNVPGFPPAPSSCQNTGSDLAAQFSSAVNGVLGISNFTQDCGSGCVNSTRNGLYYACAGSSCSASRATLSQQTTNPIAALAAGYNNGSILDFPAVPATGQASVTGQLILGIGTQSNNALAAGAQVYPLDSSGNFQVAVNGGAATSGFLDSGSNGYFLYLSDLQNQTCGGFYCPSNPYTLQTVTTGATGSPSAQQSAVLYNANALFSTQYAALPGLGGTAAIDGLVDLGMPFFYGRRIATGLQGTNANAPNGYWAY